MPNSDPAWHKREDLFIVPPGGWLLVATLLLSVVLAGGRPIWAQGVLAIGVGLLWVMYPPAKWPATSAIWVLVALAVAPLAAYLPAAWLGMPGWREALGSVRAIAASPFVSPQPWFTLQMWLLWMCGVAVAAWCATRIWDHYHRDTLARMYTGGLVVVALYAIFGYATGLNPPLWQSTDGFGPFSSRNGWGSALGMAGIMALAIVHQSLRHDDRRGVIFWGLVLTVLTGAILTNGSRGGLVVFVVGGFAYWMFFGLARKQYRYAAIAFSFLLISFALFAVGGGTLLERFVGTFEQGLTGDLRVEFYRMTLNVVRDAPVAGFGLGNFTFVFPFYLDYEPIAQWRPLHPDNSFIFLASEGGWLLVLVVAAAFAVFFTLSFRGRKSRATTIRCAGLACAAVIILNAFFEVSAHRIGVLLPAIFLAALALPAAAGANLGRWAQVALRLGGAGLIVVGLVWVVAGFGRPLWPGIQGTSALRAAAGEANEAGRQAEAIALLEQSCRLKPLDWDAHWALAAYYFAGDQGDHAWNQFRAVEALLPNVEWMVEQEGYFWLPTNAARAVHAWNRALQRSPRGQRVNKYAGFLRASVPQPAVQALLLRLYTDDPELEFVRIRSAGAEGERRLPRLLAMTDNLANAPDHMIDPVLRYMLERSRGADVQRITEESPRLKRLGWRVLSTQAVQEKNLAHALELYFLFAPRPALPAPISRSDLRSVERASALAPMDIATSIAYYQALESARRRDDAFWQLRRIMELPNAPAYIWYLAARAANERGLHEEAWQFLQTYEQRSKS
jgi:O-antigen ligase